MAGECRGRVCGEPAGGGDAADAAADLQATADGGGRGDDVAAEHVRCHRCPSGEKA